MARLPKYLRFYIVALVFSAGCAANQGAVQMPAREAEPMQSQAPLHYVVNLNDRADDLFHVRLDVDDLSPENAVYQFASTAPGTYQVMDIGRYVRSFEAFDVDGKPVPSEKVGTNQWRISEPERVTRIEYALAETWDTPVKTHHVYKMCGTSIEADHALINGQAVFGYPTGMQDRALRVTIERPPSWMVGTALETDRTGAFLAENYDEIVDSPILMGRLSKASLDVRGAAVDIYTYSKTDYVQSAEILDAVDDILNAAGDFLVDLPVDHYAFLFHFEDASSGAWEHSYSSTYVYNEGNFDQDIRASIPNVVAHEFFHVVTPLNIHSEIIEHFNFVTPVPSRHLWLYEGTTEWAAHIMQLRDGLITLDQYLDMIQHKLLVNDNYDKSYSLTKLALTSYQDEGYKQYGNIYMRGALVAGLLDIRLLELSDGRRGLREVLLDLSQRYGKHRAFQDASFFDTFTEMTYPEVRQFFRDYVEGTKPLPIGEYYGKLGIAYYDTLTTGEEAAASGVVITFNGTAFAIGQVSDLGAQCGFQAGDEIVGVNGETLTFSNYQQVFASFTGVPAGVDYRMTVVRDGAEKTITCHKEMQERVETHVLEPEENPTPQESALRDVWMENLKPS